MYARVEVEVEERKRRGGAVWEGGEEYKAKENKEKVIEESRRIVKV